MDLQSLWVWLSQPDNQNTLGWLGGGLVIVCAGLWAIIKFFRDRKERDPSVHVTADRGATAVGRDYVRGGETKPKKR